MATTFSDLGSVAGMKKLDDYLSTHSYITGDRASKDDITIHAVLSQPPSAKFINVRRWYHHMEALLRIFAMSGESAGVTIEGSSSVEAVATPPVADEKSAAAADEDDNDVDLFGVETEAEKKADEERTVTIKASSKKESGKSSVLLDVKPWDDETDMKKLEESVRGIRMEGLLWGAWMMKYCTELQHHISLFEQHFFLHAVKFDTKLVPAGYGIEKLQIMLTVVDDLVSVNTLMEDHVTAKPVNAYVQSCDIVSFNKISSQPRRKRRHRKKKFASRLLTILENGEDDTDLFREAAYNNNGHIGNDVVLSMRESWAGELRQRTLGGADDAAIVKPAEANISVSDVNNPVKRLETAESLDWKHLMAEDFFVQKSPLRYFMDEMSSGNSLRSTTTLGNEKERERVYDTIFQLPWRCEMLINVGVFVCFDSFLSMLTIMPTRIVILLWRILTKRELTRPTAAELSDFGCFIVLASGVALLERTDISLIYHMIRGQGTIKLYVVYNVLEIFDKLCQSFGGDVLQTLFNSAEVLASSTRENMTSCTGRYFSDLALAVAASIVHSFILLAQAITLSTCIVAHNNALPAMLVSNNFAEIKSNVFKRFSKDNIHSIVYYDSIERFHISAFVLFVLAQNILEAEGPWFESFIFNALMVFFCEIAIDTIKHSFIAKFNDIKPIVYSEFLEDLCKQTLNIQTDLKTNLTFVPLAPACVVIRVLTPVYAVLLPHHSFPWKLFWVLLLVFMTYVMLASLKVMIHMGLQKYSKWYVNRCEKRRHHLHVD